MTKLLICLITLCTSCSGRREGKVAEHNNSIPSIPNQQYYFIRTMRERDDTLELDEWTKLDSTFHISATKNVDCRFGRLEISKYTNEPGAPTDGGMELFYERSVGVIYSRSLTWPEYTKVHFYDDSLNAKVTLIIDRIMADPKLCNFPVFDTTKIDIKKFTTPKIE